MKIHKIFIGITLLFLVMGVASATDMVDIFKAPSPLQALGNSGYADGQGHNIQIMEYDESSHDIWFVNDTDYLVQPYENNNSFYTYVDASDVDPDGVEQVGVLEVVEKDGSRYIINSWTPNDNSEKDVQLIFSNLLEFNKLNRLTPMEL